MSVYSMTGYASAQYGASAEGAEAPTGNRRLGLEIRSVNSRFLDLSFRLPDELRMHEPALRTLLTAQSVLTIISQDTHHETPTCRAGSRLYVATA